MTQANRRTPWGWIALILIIVVLAAGFFFMQSRAANLAAGEFDTAEVDLITVRTTVDASGSVQPRQSAVLYWKTTGMVGEVPVRVGDQVEAGALLMALDPATTPPNIISAQAELIAAQEALNTLLNPSMMTVANAQSSTADAYLAIAQAEDNLNRLIDLTSGVDTALDQAVTDARNALADSRELYPLANASLEAQMLYRAMRTTDRAFAVYQDLEEQYDDADSEQQPELLPALNAAEASYEAAQALEKELASELDEEAVDLLDTQSQAQADYDEAVTEFINDISGDNAQLKAVNLVKAQAQVTLAEASLFDALQHLNTLKSRPDSADLAAAEARLQAAQASVDLAVLTAPFSGEVLAVYYKSGDLANQQQPAVTLADLSELYITVLVDETEVTSIEVGDPVSVTFSALPDVELEGQVSEIGMMGQTVQGLVKYEVDVLLNPTDVQIPLGVTADISIEINIEENVIAVPIEALQSDSQGEFVNIVASDGTLQRINVESGAIVGDDVAVEGNLQAGDTVQIIDPQAGNPFGPGN